MRRAVLLGLPASGVLLVGAAPAHADYVPLAPLTTVGGATAALQSLGGDAAAAGQLTSLAGQYAPSTALAFVQAQTAGGPSVPVSTSTASVTPAAGPSEAAVAAAGQTVAAAYRTVLLREPDPAAGGFVTEVAAGTVTYDQLVATLQASPEARARTAAAAQQTVATAYRAVLGRDPDPAGAALVGARVAAGELNYDQLVATLLASAESHARAGAIGRQAVTDAYHEVLGRDPDPSGAAFFAPRVASGELTYAQLVAALRSSPEGLARAAAPR